MLDDDKKEGTELIISKARTRAAAKQCSVASEFYEALDRQVRSLIENAERRALENKRKTIKACDL
jgi:histone H3/H4